MAIVKVAMNISHILPYLGTTILFMIMMKFTLPIAILTHTATYKTFALRFRVILICVTFASVQLYVKHWQATESISSQSLNIIQVRNLVFSSGCRKMLHYNHCQNSPRRIDIQLCLQRNYRIFVI